MLNHLLIQLTTRHLHSTPIKHINYKAEHYMSSEAAKKIM